MKSVLGALAVCALLFNTAYAYTKLGAGGGGWLGAGSGDGEEDLGNLTVTVPQPRLYDLITYEYRVYAQLYWKNESSGEWEDYELTVRGQLRRAWAGVKEARDGFWELHSAAEYDIDTSGTFQLYTASSGGEPLTIGGSLEAKRKEFHELNTRRIINSYTTGSVEIDRLPRYNVPLSFRGKADAYPDPNRELEETVDEKLFARGQTLRRGDSGTFTIDTYYEEYNFTIGTRYNWSVPSAQRIAGLRALRIDVCADLFGQEAGNSSESFFWFNESIWISSECPFPVKRHSLSNQTWYDRDQQGNVYMTRFVLETENTMARGGYTAGTVPIPWGEPSETVFAKRHPKGEFSPWQTAPLDGVGITSSSFDFGIEEAIEEAKKNSTGLQDFLNRYSYPGRRVFVSGAQYNASLDPTDINNRAGTYRWNLTFSFQPTRAEYQDARERGESNFSYSIVVIKNVTRRLVGLKTVYTELVQIEHDWGLRRGTSQLPRERMAPEGCTLASGEDIMLLHPEVRARVLSSRTGEIDWKDNNYYLGVAGLGGGGAGYQLIETLTGIQFPSADYAWFVQTNSLYREGTTFGAAVDVETGQLVYVLDVEGTALLGIFG
ncbi:MAG: hypothetical protein QXH42_08110 [Thermoplasmata archaeon]